MANKDFNFDLLPVELKHEILRKLKTVFLQDVCAKVSQQWEGMVADIVNQRLLQIPNLIPTSIRRELNNEIQSDSENAQLQLLRLFETSYLERRFNVTAVKVNDDALNHKKSKGIIYRLWKSRPCECKVLEEECIIRTAKIMSAMNLLIAQAASGLFFLNLRDLERLNQTYNIRDLKYQCFHHGTNDTVTWSDSSASTDISVFRDEVAIEEKPKTVLLFKVMRCDHKNRQIHIQRLRRIHLPLWTRSLCLLEDSLYVVYSSGHIGTWNKVKDELSISDRAITLSENNAPHNCKLFRVGSLVFLRSRINQSYSWYILDAEPTDMDEITFESTDINGFVTSTFLEELSWVCEEVFYVGVWCNFFIVHCRVQSGDSQNATTTENRLLIQLMDRLPLISDFIVGPSYQQFLSKPIGSKGRSTILNGSIISPFLPVTLKPWQLEPQITEPVPVVDLVSVEWPLRERDRMGGGIRKLCVYRVRIAKMSDKDQRN